MLTAGGSHAGGRTSAPIKQGLQVTVQERK
jgi:hypothetical protein